MEAQRLGSTHPAAIAIRTPPHAPRLSTGRSTQGPACRGGYDKGPWPFSIQSVASLCGKDSLGRTEAGPVTPLTRAGASDTPPSQPQILSRFQVRGH